MQLPDVMPDLEAKVREGATAAIRARWESGRAMNNLKGNNKQLPKGVLAAWSEELTALGFTAASKSELGYRMMFAKKFPTEADVSNAVRKFGSWHAITQEALYNTRPDIPKPGRSSELDKAKALIKKLDAKMLDELLAFIQKRRQSKNFIEVSK